MKVLLALQQLSGDGVSRFALDLGAELRSLGAKAKLFVFLPLSFLFTFAHLPFLLKNGLSGEGKDEAASELPHD